MDAFKQVGWKSNFVFVPFWPAVPSPVSVQSVTEQTWQQESGWGGNVNHRCTVYRRTGNTADHENLPIPEVWQVEISHTKGLPRGRGVVPRPESLRDLLILTGNSSVVEIRDTKRRREKFIVTINERKLSPRLTWFLRISFKVTDGREFLEAGMY